MVLKRGQGRKNGKKVTKKASPARKTGQGTQNAWTKKELAVLSKLKTPTAIQKFVDSLVYDSSDHYYSVRSTLRTKSAHCMGGALVAACCLQRLGLGPPRVIGFEARNDDTHAVAVYQVNGLWGAVGKSNFTLIRSRDPVYRSVRELMMSYFDFYFNTKGEKSLVGYSRPFYLDRTGEAWKFAEGKVDRELAAIDNTKKTPIIRIPRPSKSKLMIAPKYLLKAGLLGSNPKGLFKPS
eukprot:TRINITY_DN8608_c0_g1_i1.p1 TRINITY_DN8608_c0_g1~~TRINITY_DN8608_c0_g1_i1.p1  ORF type:complete len:237 (+),score=40.49 TRINITY_DN8608_c0_g1_i1:103-813(+)